MNTVNLIGNLTRDPELRATNNGTSVCRFTLAVNDRRQDPKSGEWVDDTSFIPIVVWGKQADNCDKYLRKGSTCGVFGRIKTGSYTNKDGQKVYTTDVVAKSVDFVGKKEEPAKDDVPPGFHEVQEELPF